MAIGWLLLVVGVVGTVWIYWTGDNARRLEALKRIVFGVPFLVVMFFAGAIFGAYVVLSFLIDSLWELTTGRQGFTPDGHATRLWAWKDRNTRWVAYGQGSPQFIP